ncbi:MAG: Fic family protein [Nanoarchaeota archaeon]|nr:Fic family protein [Nanoarchaeota archaeon]
MCSILAQDNEKVKIIKFFQELFGRNAEELFSIHIKRILERFSINPILKSADLPYHNLRRIKNIAKKTKIIHITKQRGRDIYLIRSWEEPVKKLLAFFDIEPKFDEEEHKHIVIKHYSAFPYLQTRLQDNNQAELAKLNMKYYLEKKDLIIDKLKHYDLSELAVIGVLTKQKLSKLNNPFEITRRINDWKIKYIYNTDRIEGNALTEEEVRTVLTKGAESVKKEKKDILETVNSRTALDNIFDTTQELNKEFIKILHYCTQQGIDMNPGEYKKEENCIVNNSGELMDTTTPSQFVEERIDEMIKWYNKNKDKLHPLVLASIAHNQFLFIHPFTDGNGRVARLIFNFILIKQGFFPIIFYNDEKQKYYLALRQSKEGDMKPFIMYCSDLYRAQLEAF